MLVLWAVAVTSLVVVSLQSSAWRQAAEGREALARVRAKWAARAGIEATIAALARDTQQPNTSDAHATMIDLAEVAYDTLQQASYSIRHTEFPNEVDGPEDAASKLNINRMTREDFLTFTDMPEDVADAILDWIDADDDTRELGAESGYYLRSKTFRYEPRNAPMRNMQELELVAGVDPVLVRGEDWNLNGVLDPSEDDGDVSFPSDNGDGRLDAGWSANITTYSRDGGLTPSGKEPLDLRTAATNDIASRADLDKDQADAVAAWAARSNSKLTDFLGADLSALARAANASQSARQARALTDDQLAFLFDECVLEDSTVPKVTAGKLNINTCSKETLEHVAGITPALADVIILERDSRGQGFLSIVDLLAVPAISRQSLAGLYPYLCVRSNVFIVNSRGHDDNTGLDVEMTAVLDRSSLPIVIRDLVIK